MTPLAERLKKRIAERETIDVPISYIVGDDIPGSLKVRALTVGEKSASAEAAFQYRKGILRDIPETHAKVLIEDVEFLDDQKHIERLQRACRDALDVNRSAFPDSQYIRDTFTSAEIVKLTEWYDRAERAQAKIPETVTREQRLAIINACALVAGTEYAERVLDGMPRYILASLFVSLAADYVAATSGAEEDKFAFLADDQGA